MDSLLIVGTDTDVGKTVLTTALGSYWHTFYSRKKLGLMKLIQTGIGDRQLYQRLFSDADSIQCVTPLWFETPVAPPIAAIRENRIIDLTQVWQAFTQLQQESDFVIVEALGGLGSPVTEELTVADLAATWGFRVVLVVPVKLGAIAQTVANVALARQLKVQLQGIILSCVQSVSDEQLADWTPINLIESFTQIPVLGILPHLNNTEDLTTLASVASNLNLEALLPSYFGKF
jgi:dethiobiotin synthetase